MKPISNTHIIEARGGPIASKRLTDQQGGQMIARRCGRMRGLTACSTCYGWFMWDPQTVAWPIMARIQHWELDREVLRKCGWRQSGAIECCFCCSTPRCWYLVVCLLPGSVL